MELSNILVKRFLPCSNSNSTLKIYCQNKRYVLFITVMIAVSLEFFGLVSGLGSMSNVAVSYGGDGEAFCGLKSDGSYTANCYGSNPVIVYSTPKHLSFLGLTGGDGFVCGLLMDTYKPYCWGSSNLVQMGVPQPMEPSWNYVEISAGDHHLCALRRHLRRESFSVVDCWGFNMSSTHVFEGRIKGISGGDGFNCGLFVENRTAVCWGDDRSSRVISSLPTRMSFRMISAGSFHVCGIVEGVDSRPFCWGKGNVVLTPRVSLVSVVVGRFHACGIRRVDRAVVCWGDIVERSTRPPRDVPVYSIVAGDYFTCGIRAGTSLSSVCWGYGFPTSHLPKPAVPGVCRPTPCPPGFYEFKQGSETCKPPNRYMCLPCKSPSCASERKHSRFWLVQLPVIVAEVIFAVFIAIVVSLTAVLYVRYRLRYCKCSLRRNSDSSSSRSLKLRPEVDEIKIRRAKVFTFKELQQATGGFKESSIVGRGSFSCVFKGVLKDGTTVAVKRAVMPFDQKKNLKEFQNELDLLSRLNHAHLLSLLGYCEEAEERLLVYEFMANGSLHQHLHGKDAALLDWVRRVTITVQAARGIEYLHGYACPPVIHRDIKSSNILIDEEHNARVADFGLSLLGPTDSGSPLAELPAGTLGYLDPEYYRLHYLTTKSDVYSFGVLVLEILSGRKAIDMKFEHGNIVEWAVPLIKSGDVHAILDPSLNLPPDIEALKRIANVACKCVRMRGKDRPSMDQVTTALERALAILMGTPCSEQPILPTEVVLGSSRMHKKTSQQSSETDIGSSVEEHHRSEYRAPSWITFPSVTSSHCHKSSLSDNDVENARHFETGVKVTEGLVSLDEEIGLASPREKMYLEHNF